MTLVIAGHVDVGKSTLVGSMLRAAGIVSKHSLRKLSCEADLQGKGSFFLAWNLDETDSERAHGVTIDVAERELCTPNRAFTLLDAPGHRDFIPNMISGAALADAAVLVVTAAPGEFESSTGSAAQTREHAVLLKALGINQVLVAVNKMDKTLPEPFDSARFQQVCTLVTGMLESLRFNLDLVSFIPVSGFTGDNVSTTLLPEKLTSWYAGPSLLDALDALRVPHRPINASLRVVVTSVLLGADGVNYSGSQGGSGSRFDVAIKVLQGRIRTGRGVGIAPTLGIADVCKLTTSDGTPVQLLRAGDTGVATLADRGGRSAAEVSPWDGMILYKGQPSVRSSQRFKATILTMENLNPPMLPGSTFDIYLHGESLQCRLRKIYHTTVTKATGESRQVRRPKCVGKNRSAYVQIQTERPVCVEPFSECKALGRFAMRHRGMTSAVGIVEKLRPEKKI